MELLYLLPLLLIALIIGAIYWYKKRQAQKLALLIQSFGCPKEDAACPPEILEQIAKYYEMAYPDRDEQSGVDQTTWEDLDMDSVFMALNHTLTSPGEEVLYAQLHHTTCGDQQLEELEKWMALFTQDPSLRGKAMLALQKLSKNPFHHSVDFLYHPSERRLAFPALYVILALLPIVFAIAGIFQPYFFLLLIPSFLVNGLLHFRAGMKMQQQIGAVRYLSSITLCAKRLGRIGHPDLEPICQEIKQLLRPFQKITRLSRFFFATTGTDMDILLEYLKILFLTNEIVYLRLVGVIRKHSLLLRQMYELVGRLDELIVFRPLAEDSLCAIAEKLLGQLEARAARNGYQLTHTPRVGAVLAARARSPYGARELRRQVDRAVEQALANQIASGTARTGQHWTADCTVDGAIVLEEGEVVEQTIG